MIGAIMLIGSLAQAQTGGRDLATPRSGGVGGTEIVQDGLSPLSRCGGGDQGPSSAMMFDGGGKSAAAPACPPSAEASSAITAPATTGSGVNGAGVMPVLNVPPSPPSYCTAPGMVTASAASATPGFPGC